MEKSITPGLNAQCYSVDEGEGLVVADKEGNLFKVTPDGKVVEIFTASFDKNYYFNYQDINQDRKSEFIFADENQLMVYTSAGDKIFSTKLDGNITANPAVFMASTTVHPLFLAVTDEGKGYVVKADGSVYQGFPFESNFTPTVVKLSENSNIVGAIRVTTSGELKFYRIAQ